MATQFSEADSAARKAASVLRDHILAGHEGEYLGSESELLERLGISRPTFRQAARLLEHEQLLVIKRGVGGGFYSRRPSIHTVANSAALYLHFKAATMADIFQSSRPLTEELVRQAVKCSDETLKKEMSDLVEQSKLISSLQAFFQVEEQFMSLLGRMCSNPVANLFIAILYQFGIRQKSMGFFLRYPERRAQWEENRVGIMNAILLGQEGDAVSLASFRGELLMSWVNAHEHEQDALYQ